MTATFYRTGAYKTDHSTFGGLVYLSDFCTDYRAKNNKNGSAVAKRIASDRKFDEQCRKNRINKLNYGGNKNA